jgi:hypothetical protein
MFKFLSSIFKKEKKEELSAKDKIRVEYLDQLEKLTAPKKRVGIKELRYVIRGFFKAYFEIDYEFTYQELKTELDNRRMRKESREKINAFLNTLNDCFFNTEDGCIIRPKEVCEEFKKLVYSI